MGAGASQDFFNRGFMAHCYFITSLAGHRIIASSTGSVNTTVPFSSGVEDGIILTAGSFAGAAQAVKEISNIRMDRKVAIFLI